jgi:hypothetical protein
VVEALNQTTAPGRELFSHCYTEQMRRPLVVGLINYLFPGVGYLILGKRVPFACLVIAAVVVQIAQLYVDPLPYIATYGSTPFAVFLGFFAIFLIELAFGCDAYMLAKETQSELC